ncbi:MAG TPA: LysM peptidoglycan-binding domain-containing protein [Polyangiales bacterium]
MLALGQAASARADTTSLGAGASARTHTVRSGQSLGSIARKYDVTVWSLAARNGIAPDASVREGQVLNLPEKGVVYINEGQTLWSVARRHNCSVEVLARENGLTTSSALRPGMRLRLPGVTPVTHAAAQGAHAAQQGKTVAAPAPGGKSWGTPQRPGRAELYRIATKQRLVISLVDGRGRVRNQAPSQLATFLRPRNSVKIKAPQKRLIALLAQVSDHFGGRRISVVSGYRLAGGNTSHVSRHVAGAAIDLHVEGVPNRALCDYLRHFDDVGVGFYPNSTFVHFDVRDRNAYWIDVSGPGQKAIYLARDARDTYTGNRTEGLTELGASVGAALEEMAHGEPTPEESDDE